MAKQTVTITRNYTRTTTIKMKRNNSNPIAKRLQRKMHPTTDCCVHKVHSKWGA